MKIKPLHDHTCLSVNKQHLKISLTKRFNQSRPICHALHEDSVVQFQKVIALQSATHSFFLP